MPKTKQFIQPAPCRRITRLQFDRIQMLDSMLYDRGHLPPREKLLKLVNCRLESPIKIRTLDNDISLLRKKLHEAGEKVKLVTDANGYHYSDRGYSLFGCRLTEEDRWLMELGQGLILSFLGRETAEKFGSLCDRALEMIPGTQRHGSFMGLPEELFQNEFRPDPREASWVMPLVRAIRKREALRILWTDALTPVEGHYSPYQIQLAQDGYKILAHELDPSGRTKGRVRSLPLSAIKDLCVSNRNYHMESRIEVVGFELSNVFRHSLGSMERRQTNGSGHARLRA